MGTVRRDTCLLPLNKESVTVASSWGTVEALRDIYKPPMPWFSSRDSDLTGGMSLGIRTSKSCPSDANEQAAW